MKITKLLAITLILIEIFLFYLCKHLGITIPGYVAYSILFMTTIVIMYKRVRIDFFSLPTMFILLVYLFNFGNIILIAMNKYEYIFFNAIKELDKMQLVSLIEFSVISIGFISIGSIMASNGWEINIKSLKEKTNMDRILVIGLILFAISSIPNLYVLIQKTIAYVQGNYLSTYRVEYSGLIGLLAMPFNASIIFILVGSIKNDLRFKIVLGLSSIYYLVYMFIGIRSFPTVMLITLFFIYFKLHKSFRLKRIIAYILIGYVFFNFIKTISDIRIYNPTLEKFIISFFSNTLEEIFLGILGEFGSTLVSLVYSMKFFPGYHDYLLGESYYIGIFSIFPNIGGLLGSIPDKYAFINYFPQEYRQFLGGSVLGELFANFGFFGSFLSIIIGLIIGKINNLIIKYANLGQGEKLSIAILLMPFFLLWIRDYFYYFIFETFWISVIVFVIYLIFNGERNGKRRV